MAVLTVGTYVVAGVAKLRISGLAWLDGDVLRHQIAFDNTRKELLGDVSSPFAGWFLRQGWLLGPAAVATMVVELGATACPARPPLGVGLECDGVRLPRRHHRVHGDSVPVSAPRHCAGAAAADGAPRGVAAPALTGPERGARDQAGGVRGLADETADQGLRSGHQTVVANAGVVPTCPS